MSPFTLKIAECNGEAECCASLFSPADRPHSVVNARISATADGSYSWRMGVYPSSDIVSREIIRTGPWNADKTSDMLDALSVGGTLINIGANIGWFPLTVAYAGGRVVAVEPGEENLAMMRHSLCLAPPEERERVGILPTGLGARDVMHCEMWTTPDANRGDMNTVCDSSGKSASAKWMRGRHFRKLGEVTLSRFVKFEKGEHVVVKIDVKGFEPVALAGAQGFLRDVRPSLIFAEYCPKMLARAATSVGATPEEAEKAPERFLNEMRGRGYGTEVIPTGRDGIWGQILNVVFRREGE